MVATQRELFFLHAMENTEIVNVFAFAANYFGRVARAPTRGISVGGMITQITWHLRFKLNLSSKTSVVGKAKIDMVSLIHQGMIDITHNSYSLMSHSRFILELSDPRRVSITDLTKWLYASVVLEEEDDHNVDDFVTGETMEEDATF